jgi:thiamine biosynthesis lipoprotein
VIRVERIMGTAVRFDLGGAPLDGEAVDAAVAYLRWVEAIFTVHSPDSQIRRIAAGTLAVAEADPAVGKVLERCFQLRILTDGWFDHRPDTPDLDPSGYVKGWAIQQAADRLAAAGVRRFFIDAGGDIVLRGGGRSWRVGIKDPARPSVARAALSVEDGAVASSGRYERGEHIWGSPGRNLASVTVVGPDLGTADALATAVLAADGAEVEWLGRFPSYAVVAVEAGGRLRATPGAPLAA